MGSVEENTVVLIPSFNEARTIGEVVKKVLAMGLKALVVDDGSEDDTGSVAAAAGAELILRGENRGKGYSIREGIDRILEKKGYDWVLIMDGDGQHNPSDISSLMDATRNPKVDVVIGNRMEDPGSMPAVRYWTNRFTSWVVSRLCGTHIPDTQCGFRLLRLSAVDSLELTTDKYDFESEILIQAAARGLKIVSAPVKTIYGEEVSEIHPLRDTINFFSLISRYGKNRKSEWE